MLVTRSISVPLARLAAGAETLGSGDFSHRLEVNGKDELAVVSDAFNKAAAQIEKLHSGLECVVAERTADLLRANENLLKLSSQDPLTGIANRRSLDEKLSQEMQDAAGKRLPISLLMADVDYFKKLNDAYGHQTGDECLIQVVRAMQSVPLRGEDLIARYGGEEFAVVLVNTDPAGARRVAERMRLAVENLAIPNCGSPNSKYVSVSIGVATIWPQRETPIGALFEEADQALYRAKQNGRNCVRAA